MALKVGYRGPRLDVQDCAGTTGNGGLRAADRRTGWERPFGLSLRAEQPLQNWRGQGESDCLIKTKHCDGRGRC